jgi:hypothetical protein
VYVVESEKGKGESKKGRRKWKGKSGKEYAISKAFRLSAFAFNL